jgi:hypothetical protein
MLAERRLASLLDDITEKCGEIPRIRPGSEDSALTTCVVDLSALCKLLANVAALCKQHGLAGDCDSFRKFESDLHEHNTATVLPILARGKSANEIAAIRERYGPFELQSDSKRDKLRWIVITGIVSQIDEHARTLLNSIDRRTTSAQRKRRVPREILTPPQVAKQLGVDPNTVIGWIRTSQLKGANVGSGDQRPRYKIKRTDLDDFLESRQPEAPRKRQRRPKKPADEIEFFS